MDVRLDITQYVRLTRTTLNRKKHCHTRRRLQKRATKCQMFRGNEILHVVIFFVDIIGLSNFGLIIIPAGLDL